MALNITISGYRDRLCFGYIACRRSVPALQRMLDYTHNAIVELETALGLGTHHAHHTDTTAPAAAPAAATKVATPAKVPRKKAKPKLP